MSGAVQVAGVFLSEHHGFGLVFDTVPLMAAYPDAPLQNGTQCWVVELHDSYTLEKSSGEAVDAVGYTVVAAASGGAARWHRGCVPSDHWRRQLNWSIDVVAGSNRNTGAPGSPLRDWEEFRRRHGRRLGDGTSEHTVTFIGDTTGDADGIVSAQLTFDMTIERYPEMLYIYGTRRILYSGSVTAYQAWSTALSRYCQLTDAAIPVSWTASALVGRMIRLTSGPNAGACGWVVKDLGAKTALVHFFWDGPTWSPCETAVGQTFDVCGVTKFTGSLFGTTGTNNPWFFQANLLVNGANEFMWTTEGGFGFCQCSVDISHWQSYASAAHLLGCLCTAGSSDIDAADGEVSATVVQNARLTCTSGRLRISSECLFVDNGGIVATKDGRVEIETDCAFRDNVAQPSIDIGAADQGGTVHVQDNVTLWGTGNTAPYAIMIRTDASLIYSAISVIPRILGSVTADSYVGGIGATFAVLWAGVVNGMNLARSAQET